MQLLVAGATGLVGRSLVALAAEQGHKVTAVGRRPVVGVHANVRTDFTDELEVPQADVALCALGTTIADAGSRAAFRAIDHDAVLRFAEASREAGARHFVVVTAIGASVRSPVFYSRVKGETEADLRQLDFARLDVLRPGLLLGERDAHRPGEALFQRVDPLLRRIMVGPLDRYAGVPAATVAAAMLALCSHDAPGVFVHENGDMRRLAGT
jgi:uncharacterized protein YbjT (DUF2867 family)